jgi:hypothetical protein
MRCFLTYSRKPCAGMGSAKWTCVACPLALWPTHAHRRARQLHAVLRIAVASVCACTCLLHAPRTAPSNVQHAPAKRWMRSEGA